MTRCVGVKQIIVTFSEKRQKKIWYQLYMAEEDVPWEQWFERFFDSAIQIEYIFTLAGISMSNFANTGTNEVCRFVVFHGNAINHYSFADR